MYGAWRPEKDSGAAACPSLGSSPVPSVHTPSVAHLHPAPSWLGAGEGLACSSRRLQHLHPLLQLTDVRLQVSVADLGLLQLAAG